MNSILQPLMNCYKYIFPDKITVFEFAVGDKLRFTPCAIILYGFNVRGTVTVISEDKVTIETKDHFHYTFEEFFFIKDE